MPRKSGAGIDGRLAAASRRNLTLNGALNLRFVNGYAPRQGESVSVLKVSGATTGDVTGINVSGLAPGAQFNVAMTNGTLTATAMNDTVSLPVVSIPLAPKKIGEKAKRGGAAIFKRKGDVTAPLTVSYSIPWQCRQRHRSHPAHWGGHLSREKRKL